MQRAGLGQVVLKCGIVPGWSKGPETDSHSRLRHIAYSSYFITLCVGPLTGTEILIFALQPQLPLGLVELDLGSMQL